MKIMMSLALLLSWTVQLNSSFASSKEELTSPPAPAPGVAIKVQKQYQQLLLKFRNVKYVATATCDERSGALFTDFSSIGPMMDCIAVRMERASDVSAVEHVLENPLRQGGVLIHFTDRDPIPGKGGITIHN